MVLEACPLEPLGHDTLSVWIRFQLRGRQWQAQERETFGVGRPRAAVELQPMGLPVAQERATHGAPLCFDHERLAGRPWKWVARVVLVAPVAVLRLQELGTESSEEDPVGRGLVRVPLEPLALEILGGEICLEIQVALAELLAERVPEHR